jgi:hypothetical protein
MVTVPLRVAPVAGAAVAAPAVGAVDAPGEEQAPTAMAASSVKAPIRFERLSVTRWFLQMRPGQAWRPGIRFQTRGQHRQGP